MKTELCLVVNDNEYVALSARTLPTFNTLILSRCRQWFKIEEVRHDDGVVVVSVEMNDEEMAHEEFLEWL